MKKKLSLDGLEVVSFVTGKIEKGGQKPCSAYCFDLTFCVDCSLTTCTGAFTCTYNDLC